jgi:nucleoside-diphosphate-sugar epimerase
MKENQKILIIGYGYIGSALYESLKLDIGLDITILDDNCYNEENKSIDFLNKSIEDFEKYYKFDIIILTAGQSSVKDSDNLDLVIHNNITNFSLILSKLNSNQKFIYMSSASVYGNTNGEIVNEMYTLKTPFNYYDMSKQTIDNITNISKSIVNPQIFGLRLGSVNGVSPKMRNDIIINSMVNNGLKGDLKIINQKKNRAILGMNDLICAIHKIIYLGNQSNSGIYNLNSFNNSVGEIGEKVRSRLFLNNVKIDSNDIRKDYDFKMTSKKFCDTFDFKFNDTLNSIISELIQLKYKIVDSCKICKTKVNTLLDLGNQPLANNYKLSKNELCYYFPLKVMLCNNCYHIQLSTIVNKDLLFKDYVYLSGTSKTLRNYFKEFALYSILKWSSKQTLPKSIRILDIACNDATQLDEFRNVIKELGDLVEVITVGIDPAQNIYNNITSKKFEHDIYCDYFDHTIVEKLKGQTFDIIIAQNVLGHVEYPDEFLLNCKELMNENSLLFIQTSQKNMIIENQFDTCYHEHQSFFCTNSMNELTSNCGLVLNNVIDNEIHGSSYIFEICKNKITNSSNVIETLNNEINNGLYNKKVYLNYKSECLKYRDNLVSKLSELKKNGKQIIGFGSTAKSNTVLNFAKIDNNIIDYIIDENHLKQNLYTPGSNIIITDITLLKTLKPNSVILIMAWNFYKEILKKIQLKLIEYNIQFSIEIININTLETNLI